MPYQWISDAFGGGPTGVLAVLLAIVVVAFYWHLLAQLKERKEENRDLRETLDRLTSVVEAEAQRRLPRR